MKFNKWTLGLAAVGVVSLTSAARADEKMNSLQTALSNTTISGSVSVSANWAITPGGESSAEDSPAAGIPFQGPNKVDGFNLDVVRLTIAKPEDESPWASGYQVDLMFGPDAVNYNPSANGVGGQFGGGGTSADFAIKQAYVTLRTPVGNGIDWKIGVFDTIIGYEVTDSQLDPNYTRSWGYFVEPTEHTGILGTYKINDDWSVSAGVANTLMAGINNRDIEDGYGTFWHKTLMASVTYTAPSSWGWAAGSSFYAGMVYGFAGNGGGNSGGYAGADQINYYAGVTLNTPLKQLTTGFAFDYVHNLGGGYAYSNGYSDHADVWVIGAYATYKVNDKLSFDGRAEYLNGTYFEDFGGSQFFSYTEDGYELTATMEYDMWANVMSRLELRWDHANSNFIAGFGDVDHKDSVGLYANVIYKF